MANEKSAGKEDAPRREARTRPVRRRVGNEKLLFVGLGVLFLLRVVVGRVAAIVR